MKTFPCTGVCRALCLPACEYIESHDAEPLFAPPALFSHTLTCSRSLTKDHLHMWLTEPLKSLAVRSMFNAAPLFWAESIGTSYLSAPGYVLVGNRRPCLHKPRRATDLCCYVALMPVVYEAPSGSLLFRYFFYPVMMSSGHALALERSLHSVCLDGVSIYICDSCVAL